LHFTKDDFVHIPVGIVRFPLEDPFPPRKYIERCYNVQHWADMQCAALGRYACRGGIFPQWKSRNCWRMTLRLSFRSLNSDSAEIEAGHVGAEQSEKQVEFNRKGETGKIILPR